MGFVTLPDDNSTTEALEALKKVETVKKRMDIGRQSGRDGREDEEVIGNSRRDRIQLQPAFQ
jgi:hypothetical protein